MHVQDTYITYINKPLASSPYTGIEYQKLATSYRVNLKSLRFVFLYLEL